MSDGAKTVVAGVVVFGILYYLYKSTGTSSSGSGAVTGAGGANPWNNVPTFLGGTSGGAGAAPTNPLATAALTSGRITGAAIQPTATISVAKYAPGTAAIASGRIKCNVPNVMIGGSCRTPDQAAKINGTTSTGGGAAGTSSTGYTPAIKGYTPAFAPIKM